jgi:hypothetical protein
MKTGEIKSFRDKVMATDYFMSLSKVIQTITLKRNNLLHIEHGYNVSKNRGYDYWERTSNAMQRNKEIVKELLELGL